MNGVYMWNSTKAAYATAVAAKDLVTFESSLEQACHDRKVSAVFKKILPPMVQLMSSLSGCVLGANLVALVNLGPYLNPVERLCYASSSLFYGIDATQEQALLEGAWMDDQPKHVWNLVKDISFLGWNLINLIRVSLNIAIHPAFSYLLMACGVSSFVLSYLRDRHQPQ